MDSARCTCLGAIVNTTCPFHGVSEKHPRNPYALTETDKNFLRTLRIDPFDTELIHEIRKADEDRFRRD